MERIREYFEEVTTVNETDWKYFSSKLIKMSFSKNQIILKTGQTENYLSFIERGIIRYYIQGDENDLTFAFVFSNNFMSGYDSFLTRTPSTYNIEALTDTILWRISFQDLQDVYIHTQIGNIIGRKASEELFIKKSKREISLLSENAEQRYQNLFTEQPHLFQHIPLKYIASYIGVTPQALSRIRRRIS